MGEEAYLTSFARRMTVGRVTGSALTLARAALRETGRHTRCKPVSGRAVMQKNPVVLSFVAEAADLLETLEQGFVRLEDGADDETVNALFRAAHTMKGSAGVVGARACQTFTHTMENVLARVRERTLAPTPQLVSLLLGAVDVLREFVDAIGRGEGDPPMSGDGAVLAGLTALAGTGTAAMPIETLDGVERVFRIRVVYPPEPGPSETAPALFVEELAALGKLVFVNPDPATGARKFEVVVRAAVRSADIEAMALFAEAEVRVDVVPDDRKSAPRKGAGASRKRATAVRVDGERLDQLLDLVGELAIALAGARKSLLHASASTLDRRAAFDDLESIGRDVQERVMGLRMVPVRDTFERLRRPVRDAAQALGKEVTLELEGIDTELDRSLLEALGDPLTHMVKNGVAHGVESPEKRERAGKPRAGRLIVRAQNREGQALIEIQDDGGGIDVARVVALAKERGILEHDATPTERQAYDLLFAPGFSTTAEVDEVSGRGVGLDVVKRNVESLRGRIEIQSRMGEGTLFRIRLPLTLAVIDGVNVRVNKETLIIPLVEVEAILDGRDNVMRTFEGRAEFVDVRGELLRVVRLATVLGLADLGTDETQHASIIIVRSDRRRFGVCVDDVLGLARSVWKPLDKVFSICRGSESGFVRPEALGGATILDDGRIGYVLDVHGIDGMAFPDAAA
jgi:two-component system, chemotaxis family, sensor kinase CheA